METQKTCPWCGEKFTPAHGNEAYCSADCNDAAKADRQKRKRDPIRSFIPILMNNHEVVERLYNLGKFELTKEEIEAYGIDLSLCRHLQPPPEHEDKLLLDLGVYFLITEKDFLTFKIFKHETESAVQSK